MCTIITKSLCGFLNQTSTEYYKIEIVDDKIIETEISKSEAMELIKDKPELHRIDHNNIIWGDADFKEKCPEYFKLKIDSQSPKELKILGFTIKYKAHDLIVKESNIVMSILKKHLDDQWSKLYSKLGTEKDYDHRFIYFPDYSFDYVKFNSFQDLLISLYKNKSMNLKRFLNGELDLLLYVLNIFNIEDDLREKINNEISKRIDRGEYEA